ncbi:hypothetical protein [Desulfogranum marinum]|uniref:hypothetical protein n=1 Tax=Desulfogranum marinum TaxID=453220 RepID=UPI00374CE83D
MEFINFSEQESKNIEKGLGFTSKSEINPSLIPSDLPVTKTDHYLQDCEEFLDPERTIGTENPYATVVFPNNRTSTHKLFVNQDRIKGISYIHCITNELVHLSNFIQFFKITDISTPLTRKRCSHAIIMSFYSGLNFKPKK